MEELNLNQAEETLPPVGPKTAMVSIVGRPSVGKSTFLNTASGEQISIVSAIPQTTRNAIRGIVNTSLGQLVFVDTPGLHLSEKKMNLRLSKIASDQIEDNDAILYIIDSTRDCGEEEEMIVRLLKPFVSKLVIAINKTEERGANPQKVRDFLARKIADFPSERIIEISAKNDVNVNAVLQALYALAPEAPHLYPEEFYTDQEVEFRISEVIRGKAIERLEEEVPHALYVSIDSLKMANENLLKVRASICVERESQKGIVIGKGDSMVKSIRVESEKTCRDIFPYKVGIELQVKVDKNWRQKDKVLNKILS